MDERDADDIMFQEMNDEDEADLLCDKEWRQRIGRVLQKQYGKTSDPFNEEFWTEAINDF